MACDELDKAFFTGTTMHGVGRVVERSRLVFKLLWLFLVLSLSGVCVWQITDRVVGFTQFHFNTEITLSFTSTIEFPAVTICNFNRYYNSHMTEADIPIMAQLLYAMDYEYDYSYEDYSSFDWDGWYSNLSLSSDYDYANFTRRASMHLDKDTLLSCEWRGRSSSCSAKNFTHVFTSYGNCYTFNGGDEYISQDQPGAGNGLRVLINIQQEEYTETATGNVQAGIKFLVHDKKTPPLMDSQGSAISPGTYAFVAVQQIRTLNLPHPYGTCVSTPLDYYDEYSISACLIEWRVEIIERECGCKPFRFPGPARDCTVVESATCVKDALGKIKNGDHGKSDCPVPCNMTSFPTRVSYATYPNQAVTSQMEAYYNITESYARNNLVYLDIFYDEINYEEYKQTPAMTPSALVSDIGGQIGFFLGASVITLCEFFEYFIMKCHRALRVEKKKVGTRNNDTEENNVIANGDTELAFKPRDAFS